jgi:HSP20 family protein
MSSTTTKSLVLSQPKIGSVTEVAPTSLPHRTFHDEHETVTEVEVPGIDPATVDVQFDHNILTVLCEKGQLTIPVEPTVDTSKVKADIKWGMLTLRVPKPEVPPSRSIRVSIHEGAAKPESKPAVKTHTTRVTTKEFTSEE